MRQNPTSRKVGEKCGHRFFCLERQRYFCGSLIIERFSMAAILDRIVAATRARVAEAKRGADLRELERRAEEHVPRGFRRALA